ncbi:MAG: AbrB/MazE/SpoVT family DNA-binding domain-containing protein [Acidobacteria bacterium]|nr:AbrB/MazE/SpoVT family DNA-binding domain-containing protein [Acidobacteriota bacterium]
MKYDTTITSKGTITIAAPIRKALGLRPGQKVRLFVNTNNNVEMDAGISAAEFQARRDELLKNVTLPKKLKGLTARELRDIAAKEGREK